MIHSYKVAAWNANGLTNHQKEVEVFLNNHKIDILLVSETHFTERHYIRFPNYTVYDTKHPAGRAHGGSAIIIRRNIKHHELPKFQTEHIQATNVSIQDWNGPLTVSAVYCPPRHNIHKEQFKGFFNTLGRRFIAGGDFNAKHQMWGSRLTTTKGRQLYQAIQDNHLETLSTGEPTYWPTDTRKVPDLIDFFIIKGISHNHSTVKSYLELSSDHTPIIAHISTCIITYERPPKLHNRKTDWCFFRRTLNDSLELNIPLKTKHDIEIAVEIFNRKIQNAAWQSTPQDKPKTNYLEYPDEIKDKLAEKRRLRRIWQNRRYPEDKRRFNTATRELRRMIQKLKNDTFQEYVQGLSATDDTDYSLWKATRQLKQATQHIPPIRNKNGTWARSDYEKANCFAEYLEEVFKPNEIPGNTTDEEEITTFLEAPLRHSPPIKFFTPQEIHKIVQERINAKKAPGYDLITGRVLKELPRKGIVHLTAICNAILRTGHYPVQWKVAQIVMIKKPDKSPDMVTSYRPVSLLPVMSKIFEKGFLKRLNPILSEKQLIPDHQFGFRRQHTTIEQVHRITKEIRKAFDEKKYCSAAFLDISQAFDKVWHPGLLYKIKKNFPQKQYEVLKSYLCDRLFQVKLKGEVTDLRKVESGVPQGSVLGPILYLIYTADLPTSQDTMTATFADDTAVIATDSAPEVATEILQSNINTLQQWMLKWKIKVNQAKSKHVTFSMRKRTCPTVKMNDVELPQVDEVKYLGMHLDRRLTWSKHIKMKRKQLNLKFNKLYWLLGKQSVLSIENKLLLYKVLLKPVWTYGIQLWGTASNSNIEILQRFQSKTLRTILNMPWYINNNMIHNDLQIKTIKEEITESSKRYINKLYSHTNPLAVNLLDNSEDINRLKKYNILDLPSRFSD